MARHRSDRLNRRGLPMFQNIGFVNLRTNSLFFFFFFGQFLGSFITPLIPKSAWICYPQKNKTPKPYIIYSRSHHILPFTTTFNSEFIMVVRTRKRSYAEEVSQSSQSSSNVRYLIDNLHQVFISVSHLNNVNCPDSLLR